MINYIFLSNIFKHVSSLYVVVHYTGLVLFFILCFYELSFRFTLSPTEHE